MYRALIFDLDGTLLDTLGDIRTALNEALKECGYSYEFSLKDAQSLIGDGADTLIKRALKDQGEDTEAFKKLKAAYLPLYKAYQDLHTKAYNGLPETLKFLSERGLKLFVVTNKPDALAKLIVTSHYGKETFAGIYGHTEGEPVKPDPILVNKILDGFSIKREDCLYVGDSVTDVDTAKNAGIDMALVTWGYGFYKPTLLEKAKFVLKKPKNLAQVVLFGRLISIKDSR